MKTSFSLPLSLAYLALFPLAAPAQIVPDGSLGAEGSVVVPAVINGLPSDQLEGGAVRGGNLFHSFGEFSVPDGRGAYFANPAGVANIFSRVTGGNISQILGTLGVLGNANLYFLNPNGIVFGPNARLDVRGSFLATTADSFIFDNGFEFSASNPTAPPLLTVNIPIGLRFRENPGDIVVRTGADNTVTEAGDAGALTDSAQTVGSPSSISGSLDDVNDVDLYQVTVPEGASVTPSTVGGSGVDTRLFLFDQSGLGLAANEDSQGTLQSALPEITQPGVYYVGISSFANSPLSEGGEIFAYDFNNFQFVGFGPGANAPLSGWNNSGFESGSYTISLSPPAPGTGNLAVSPGQSLALIGGNVRLEGGRILSPGSNVYIGGVSGAGVVSLESGFRPILPALLPRADIGIFDAEINVRAGGGGSILLEGGNIDIVGESTRVRAGIESGQGFSGAQAGDIEINGTGLITIDGAFVFNSVNIEGVGNGGDIVITGQSLLLDNGALIDSSTLGVGDSGKISIITVEGLILQGKDSQGFSSSVTNQVNSTGVGNSGGITIETGTLFLSHGGNIDATTFGQGNAGALVIKATESVTITGESSQGDRSSVSSGVLENAMGNSGGVIVETGTLLLEQGGFIDASTFGEGDSGAVAIKATESVTITGESSQGDRSSVASLVGNSGIGDSGGITLETDTLLLEQGGFIDASTFGEGNAGAVAIKAAESVTITGESNQVIRSSVSSSVLNDAMGNSGGIIVETGALLLEQGGIIDASTLGEGNAGSVVIKASESVTITGESSQGNASMVTSGVAETGVGDSGGITLETGALLLEQGGIIDASTLGEGNAGSVMIKVSESVMITGESSQGDTSSVGSQVGKTGVGNSGGITLETGTLLLEQGGSIDASTSGQGDSGTVAIKATESVTITGESSQGNASFVASQVANTGVGNSDGIILATGVLLLDQGGVISTSTFGQGNSGAVVIKASEFIAITGEDSQGFGSIVASEVGETGVGNSGGITLETGALLLEQGGNINTSTFGQGNSGTVVIKASEFIAINGEDSQGNSSNVKSGVGNTAVGNSGGITLETGALLLEQGGSITASTFGQGNSGAVVIKASELIAINGEDSQGNSSNVQSGVGNTAVGNSGGITLETSTLLLEQGGSIDASTFGKGNSGAVVIKTSEFIAINGEDSQGDSSNVQSGVGEAGVGDSGGITLETGTLLLEQGGNINANTFGKGNSGAVVIKTSESVTITGEDSQGFGSNVASEVGETGVGNSGGITLETGALLLEWGGNINTSTLGEGDAGAVVIKATESVTITGENSILGSAVLQGAVGDSGGIILEADSLLLEQGGEIEASTFGQGNSGLIDITAYDTVTITENSLMASRVNSTGIGNSGGIQVETGSLLLKEGGVISASTFGQGDSGDVTLNVKDSLQLNNAGIFAQVNEEAFGNAGNLIFNTNRLNLQDGGFISTATSGNGVAGDITVNANQGIDIIGNESSSGIFSQTFTSNAAGNISIITQTLTIQNRGIIDSETSGSGKAGNIHINASNAISVSGTGEITTSITSRTQDSGTGGNLTLITGNLAIEKGAQVTAGTFSEGDSGTVFVSADSIRLSGIGTGILTQTEGQGNSNNLTLQTQNLFVENGAVISASTTSSGQGGNLIIKSSESVELRGSNSSLQAKTEGSGNAGNVTVTTPQFIINDGAKASVETTSEGSPGNITITSDRLLIGTNAQLSATITPTSTNTTGGGSITLNASNLDISGQLGIFAETQGEAPAGSLTINPNDNNPDLNIRFT
ncbi:MAG: filamentous hemagglutinin N-terminal domain-containing protein, partial [Cyanobacteria bacterium RI_101]|nr:filamentous hemagglutinin N-terminal domain-containing protein [Cyanobacteria bacterium RI_101]